MTLPKRTKASPPRHGRWYGDACGAAFAMELLGERWALLIVRELMLGARRFTDLRASLPGISARILTERLEGLEAAGILARRQLPPPGKAQVYELTAWGAAAEPLIQAAGRWAALSRAHDPTLPLSPVSLMLSLRAMVDRAGLGEVAGRIGFVIGEDRFVATPEPGDLAIVRGDAEGADVVLAAPNASALAAGIYAGVPWAELKRKAGVSITGERALAQRFLALFRLPPPLA
ncbi:helix-turn-helix transcriptional regulator [Novosphingobium sp. 1949]|uniref:Helix-turn-helix transcriptional regulator n=1 Tax=Novosphingobium organovorum TaxID=2930092 RepID=A0ABT0B919_9SPHN|nr:helix-turn-helix domain-containing protein [Novosphingobium organovorum]MCJ2181493.1 helix-turn-helix transcriptional regulator [Novosphingobium organovorum]